MNKNIFFLVIFLLLISPYNHEVSRVRSTKIELNREKASSFQKKDNLRLYQSFVLGNKVGLKREIKRKYSELGIMHLMTPSGLHYGVLLYIFSLLQRKRKNIFFTIGELYIGVLAHTFLEGFYALRRVALLRSFRIFNSNYLPMKFSKVQIFLIFTVFDFFFGTRVFSYISFLLSILFIGLFTIHEKKSKSIFINLFLAQIIVAFFFRSNLSILNLLLAPILTALFSIIYPFLFLNIFFLDYLNYSEIIISGYQVLISEAHKIAALTGFHRVSPFTLCCAIFINRKNFLFFISSYLLHKYN